MHCFVSIATHTQNVTAVIKSDYPDAASNEKPAKNGNQHAMQPCAETNEDYFFGCLMLRYGRT